MNQWDFPRQYHLASGWKNSITLEARCGSKACGWEDEDDDDDDDDDEEEEEEEEDNWEQERTSENWQQARTEYIYSYMYMYSKCRYI